MNSPAIKSTKGFTLVELMVGLALGSLMLLGIFKIFDANFRAYNLLIADSNIQESNRIARSIILKDIQNAGSLGCSKANQDFISSELLNAGTHPQFGLDNFIGGLGLINDVAASQKISAASVIHTDNEDREVEEGTDILSMIKATAISQQMSAIGANIVTVDGNEFNKDDYLIIMDCRGRITAEIFHITGVRQNGNSQELTLNVSVQQTVSDLMNGNQQRMSTAIYKLEAISYFISEGLGSSAADKRLSIFRKVNNNAAVEYISGVDDFQVAYEAIDAANGKRSYTQGAAVTAENISIANVVHMSLVLRSDSTRTNNLFTGPALGKTKGGDYPKDGKLRRVAQFSGKIRSRF